MLGQGKEKAEVISSLKREESESNGRLMVRGILDDVTVVELAQDVAGPYGSKLLADQGANVIK
ncbi:MAG: hypothetical protein CM1200mP3_12210 [Chloroflexota bacterium]|nr:MAG: hypothetical protein CM1200mP3_12210 [Chloroflexota bacterium]